MPMRRFSNFLLVSFSILGFGCGSDGELDPNESASTRAIRETVKAQMEIERLEREGIRLAGLNAALAEAPTAVAWRQILSRAEPPEPGMSKRERKSSRPRKATTSPATTPLSARTAGWSPKATRR